MSKSILGKIKYLVLALAFLSVAPLSDNSWAGGIGGGGLNIPVAVVDTDNDAGVFQLYYFWDLRGGESFVQLTNTAPISQAFHIQVFDVSRNCQEFDFFDRYTPFDTHVYNLRSLTSNGAPGIGVGEAPILTDGYGFVVATLVDSTGPGGGNITIGNALGNFRIIRDEGYEYRTNAAGISILSIVLSLQNQAAAVGPAALAVPFAGVDGAQFVDIVGIPVVPLFDVNTFTGSGTVSAAGTIFAAFSANIFDQNEQPTSCSPVAFACDLTDSALRDTVLDLLGSNFTLGFDLGINQRYIASRPEANDGDSICLGQDTAGQLRLEAIVPLSAIFVGFYGVNNGDGTGSMDSMFSLPFFNVGFEDVFGIQPILETFGLLP
ncbi:MAG: hypothetical protein ACT4NX_07465 [Deltaproteobacteria bacterium]